MKGSDLYEGGMINEWYIISLVKTIATVDGVPEGDIINVKVERNTVSQWVAIPDMPGGGYNTISTLERACHWFKEDEEVYLP